MLIPFAAQSIDRTLTALSSLTVSGVHKCVAKAQRCTAPPPTASPHRNWVGLQLFLEGFQAADGARPPPAAVCLLLALICRAVPAQRPRSACGAHLPSACFRAASARESQVRGGHATCCAALTSAWRADRCVALALITTVGCAVGDQLSECGFASPRAPARDSARRPARRHRPMARGRSRPLQRRRRPCARRSANPRRS
jgi:hypothetical protein